MSSISKKDAGYKANNGFVDNSVVVLDQSNTNADNEYYPHKMKTNGHDNYDDNKRIISYVKNIICLAQINLYIFFWVQNRNVAKDEPNPFEDEQEDWDDSNDILVDNGEPGVLVRALYDYEGAESDELTFKQGKSASSN